MECPGDFARCSGHTCTRLICSVRFDGGFFVFVTVVFAIVVLVVVVVVIAGGGCRNSHKPRASRHRSLRPNALAAAARLPVDCPTKYSVCALFLFVRRCVAPSVNCFVTESLKLYKTCSKCSMKDRCPLAESLFHHSTCIVRSYKHASLVRIIILNCVFGTNVLNLLAAVLRIFTEISRSEILRTLWML